MRAFAMRDPPPAARPRCSGSGLLLSGPTWPGAQGVGGTGRHDVNVGFPGSHPRRRGSIGHGLITSGVAPNGWTEPPEPPEPDDLTRSRRPAGPPAAPP